MHILEGRAWLLSDNRLLARVGLLFEQLKVLHGPSLRWDTGSQYWTSPSRDSSQHPKALVHVKHEPGAIPQQFVTFGVEM